MSHSCPYGNSEAQRYKCRPCSALWRTDEDGNFEVSVDGVFNQHDAITVAEMVVQEKFEFTVMTLVHADEKGNDYNRWRVTFRRIEA